jgi:hypothetical protein
LVSRIDGTSIWDDPDAWIESFTSAPQSLRQRQLAATGHPGGLRKAVERAIRARLDMSLSEYEGHIRTVLPGRNAVLVAHSVLRRAAGFDEDGLRVEGFDQADAGIASALATASPEIAAMTPAYAALTVELARKYG